MTIEERDAVLGRLVRERQEITQNRRIAAELIKQIGSELRELGDAMNRAPRECIGVIGRLRASHPYVNIPLLTQIIEEEEELSVQQEEYDNRARVFGI